MGDRFGMIILAFSSQGLQMKMLKIAWIHRLNEDLSLHIFLWITRVLVPNNAKHLYLHFLLHSLMLRELQLDMASKLVKISDQHRCFGGYHYNHWQSIIINNFPHSSVAYELLCISREISRKLFPLF